MCECFHLMTLGNLLSEKNFTNFYSYLKVLNVVIKLKFADNNTVYYFT